MLRRVLRWLGFKVHVWDYWHPYARRCPHCGTHESKYCRPWNRAVSWWETVYPLATNPEACNLKEDDE